MLEKLDNNESVLLMYLADELPAEDRAEIERMLAGDESLRRQFASLRAAEGTAGLALQALETAPFIEVRSRLEAGSAAESAAIRRINRSMHSHLARKLIEQPAPPADRGRRYLRWAYPAGAIAAGVLACLIWWANGSNNSKLYIQGPSKDPVPVRFTSNDDARLKKFWQTEDVTQEQQINEREQELAALTSSGDDDAAIWKIGDDVHE